MIQPYLFCLHNSNLLQQVFFCLEQLFRRNLKSVIKEKILSYLKGQPYV